MNLARDVDAQMRNVRPTYREPIPRDSLDTRDSNPCFVMVAFSLVFPIPCGQTASKKYEVTQTRRKTFLQTPESRWFKSRARNHLPANPSLEFRSKSALRKVAPKRSNGGWHDRLKFQVDGVALENRVFSCDDASPRSETLNRK
jgi:hypothetical protein